MLAPRPETFFKDHDALGVTAQHVESSCSVVVEMEG